MAEAEQVVEIAADAFGRNHTRRNRRLGRDDRVGREELHLEVVRELHLVREPLQRAVNLRGRHQLRLFNYFHCAEF